MIGMDAHKLSESIRVMNSDGKIVEEYRMDNTEENWIRFMSKYPKDTEIAVESSTTGKYVARLLRDNGFRMHLAKLLRLGELPESYLPSREVDDIRSMIRYRRSLGEESTQVKNRVHSLLARNGISITASDIFGKRSLDSMLEHSGKLPNADSMILADLLSQYKSLAERIERIQDQLASMGKDIPAVMTLMTIPGVDYYTALGIYSEIGDISRFPDADHLSSYTGLVPRVDQSGSSAVYGHITKSGPSVLRFFIVNAIHTLVKLSPAFKRMYRKSRKKIGKNRSLIAMARKLAVVIYNMLARNQPFMEEHMFKTLKERKLKNMESRAGRSTRFSHEDMEKIIGEVAIVSKSKKLLS